MLLVSWTDASFKDFIDARGCRHQSTKFAHEAALGTAVVKHVAVDVDNHQAEPLDENLHQIQMQIIASLKPFEHDVASQTLQYIGNDDRVRQELHGLVPEFRRPLGIVLWTLCFIAVSGLRAPCAKKREPSGDMARVLCLQSVDRLSKASGASETVVRNDTDHAPV